MKKILLLIGLMIIGVLLSLCFYKTFSNEKSDGASLNQVTGETKSQKITGANPASVNCGEKGGNLVIVKRGDGGEFGLCYFEENRACEEWALLRGDCPAGGRKTTGYDTDDQKYCAWLGGETYAIENAVCTFKNGKICLDKDLYNGVCSPNK